MVFVFFCITLLRMSGPGFILDSVLFIGPTIKNIYIIMVTSLSFIGFQHLKSTFKQRTR